MLCKSRKSLLKWTRRVVCSMRAIIRAEQQEDWRDIAAPKVAQQFVERVLITAFGFASREGFPDGSNSMNCWSRARRNREAKESACLLSARVRRIDHTSALVLNSISPRHLQEPSLSQSALVSKH
jgi:hypothetical protein